MTRLFRIIAAALVIAFAPVTFAPPLTAQSVEVGFIENISGDYARVKIVRHDGDQPAAVYAMIRNGDRIVVPDEKTVVSLRFVDRKDPVPWALKDAATPITVTVTERSMITGLWRWLYTSVATLDTKTRVSVSANTRSGQDGPLALPLFKQPQLLPAGRYPLWVGWVGAPAVVEFSVRDSRGKVVAGGRATDWLWRSADINWLPGSYTVEVRAGNERATGTMRFMDEPPAPYPPDLSSPNMPKDVLTLGRAAWVAAQGLPRLLQALQLVAPDADRYRAAGLLTDFLTAGQLLPAP